MAQNGKQLAFRTKKKKKKREIRKGIINLMSHDYVIKKEGRHFH